MNRRGRVDDVFNIELGPSASSSQSDVYSSDSRNPLTDPGINYEINTNKTKAQHNVLGSNLLNRSLSSDAAGDMDKITKEMYKNRSERGTIRQRTINYLPSRMQRAISVDGQILSNPGNNEIDQLVDEIEQHQHLMADNPAAEQLRMDTIKAMPQSLTIKRRLRAKLTRTVTHRSNSTSISKLKRIKYSIGMRFNKTKIVFNNALSNIELWYGSMKEIEGHFGSSVATYFKFLRWLFILNMLLVLLTLCFITIPQIIFNGNTTKEIIIETSSLEEHNETNSSNELLLKQVVDEFSATDLLTAAGYLTSSILFYGAYTNLTVSVSEPHEYNIPVAYFLTMLCLYITTFIIVSSGMARSYRRSFIETYGSVHSMYAHKIFCSWDFGISNSKAAQLKHSSIYNELKEILYEINRTELKSSKMRTFWNVTSKITAHILVFLMLTGLGFGMWTVLQYIDETIDFNAWSALYLSLAINCIMLFLQLVFGWIAYMEEYKSPRTMLHVTLMRNFFLEIVIIGVLIIFWLTRNKKDCWETSIGQEVYRLVIIDFLVAVIGGAIFQIIRVIIYNKISKKVELPEFDISWASLGLVFNQTLLWMGLLFSPMLALVVTIKMILTFYIKKTTLIYLCKPPSKVWRSAQTQTWFLVLIFLSLLGVVIMHGYIITQVTVSQNCGPFRGHAYMFQIFIEGILALKEGNVFWQIIMSITKPAVIAGILLTMCVFVYYLRAKSKARRAMVKILQEMLFMESQDKEFLLSNITKVTQGKDWLFDDVMYDAAGNNGHDRFYAESSSTWQYKENPINSIENDNKPSTSRFQRLGNDDNLRNRRY